MGNRAQEQLVTYRLAILATLSSSVGINAFLLLLCSQGRVCTHVPSELTCMCASTLCWAGVLSRAQVGPGLPCASDPSSL